MWDNSRGSGNPFIWPVRLVSGQDEHLACSIMSCPLGGGFHIHASHYNFCHFGHFFPTETQFEIGSFKTEVKEEKKKPKYLKFYSNDSTISFGMIVESLKICFSERLSWTWKAALLPTLFHHRHQWISSSHVSSSPAAIRWPRRWCSGDLHQ